MMLLHDMIYGLDLSNKQLSFIRNISSLTITATNFYSLIL
jgi:hypothetical protein